MTKITRKSIFTLFKILLIGIVTLEAVCALHSWTQTGLFPYTRSAIEDFHEQLIQLLPKHTINASDESGTPPPVIAQHPYMGFVYNYDRDITFYDQPNSRFGFYSEYDAVYHKTSTNEYVVAVLGGSIATHVSVRAHNILYDKLASCPALKGRKIILNPLCQGGFKEPQSILALVYFLTLGTEVDMVISIGGINELLFVYDNVKKYHIDPSFPLHWLSLSAEQSSDPVLVNQQWVIQHILSLKVRFADLLLKTRLYPSAIARLGWNRIEKALNRQLTLAQRGLDGRYAELSEQNALTYAQTGPGYVNLQNDQDILREGAKIWENANTLLYSLLHAINIPYLVFLHPNQYYPNTKMLTEAEWANCYNTNSPFYYPLSTGYEFIREAGMNLALKGIPYYDLTEIFQNVKETTYEDECCHYTPLGNEIVASQLSEAICSFLGEIDSK